jgi:hypothetical protein
VVYFLGAVKEDSCTVEGPSRGIDGDGDGSFEEGVDEVGASRDIVVALHLDVSTLDLAVLFFDDIRIVLILHNTIVLDVIEGRVHPSSVAAHVSV